MGQRSRRIIQGKLIDVFMIMLVSMIMIPLLVATVADFVVRLTNSEVITESIVTMVAMLVQELSFIWLTIKVVLTSGYKIVDIGLHLDTWFRDLLLGILGAIGLLLINSFGGRFSIWIFEVLFSQEQVAALMERENSVIVELLQPSQPMGQFVFLLLLVGVLAPIAEEVFFRGYAYSVLRSKWGSTIAAVVTSLVFAMVHLYTIHFLPIYLLGLALCYLYERSKSLVPAIIAHGAMNLVIAWLTYSQGLI
ncbi:MAG: CPBP family intramembrane metalloprotease [Firmicutes bacterium]|nr:CPBP family intramembrane metalloprotease [Bacillota bacterium]